MDGIKIEIRTCVPAADCTDSSDKVLLTPKGVEPGREFPLYGDGMTGQCVSSCSDPYYGDPSDKTCKAECDPAFEYPDYSGYPRRCVDECFVKEEGSDYCLTIEGCSQEGYIGIRDEATD